MSSKLEPQAIWSHDTGEGRACCDSCELTKTWLPKIKDIAMVIVHSRTYVPIYVCTDVDMHSQVTTKIF